MTDLNNFRKHAREKLFSVRNKRRLVWRLQEEIRELNGNIEMLSLKATDYSAVRVTTSVCHSSVENIVLRIEAKVEQLSQAIDSFMREEDELAEAIRLLPAEQQSIIIDRYMLDKPQFKIAMEMNYSIPAIKYNQYAAEASIGEKICKKKS